MSDDDGLNVVATKPIAREWYVISSRILRPVIDSLLEEKPYVPKTSCSNMFSPVDRVKIIEMISINPPARTDVGIKDALRKGINCFIVLAKMIEPRSTPMIKTKPHALDSEKFSIFGNSFVFIGIVIVNVHIFECIEARA